MPADAATADELSPDFKHGRIGNFVMHEPMVLGHETAARGREESF